MLCIPSKHWGWSAIALGVGCLHSDRKYSYENVSMKLLKRFGLI